MLTALRFLYLPPADISPSLRYPLVYYLSSRGGLKLSVNTCPDARIVYRGSILLAQETAIIIVNYHSRHNVS